jgi:hypothetical protein
MPLGISIVDSHNGFRLPIRIGLSGSDLSACLRLMPFRDPNPVILPRLFPDNSRSVLLFSDRIGPEMFSKEVG